MSPYLYERNLKGYKMKNILAENMLRFGPKNLDSKAVRTLKRLTEQTEMSPSKLDTIAPGAAAWLTTTLQDKKKATTPNTAYYAAVGNNVLVYQTSDSVAAGSAGAGTLWIYTLDASYGWPLLKEVGRLINNQGTDWLNSSELNLWKTRNSAPNIYEVGANTDYIGKRFNTYWANLSGNPIAVIQPWMNNAEFKTECVNLVTKNQAAFQQKFKEKLTYNYPGKGPQAYKDQKVNSYTQSSYYLWIDKEITDPIARQIYELIKDPETITMLSTPKAQ
jgi:hypothetical protein